MKELAIFHSPVSVRVVYRAWEGAQPQERTVPFAFAVEDEDRALIQWYLEGYLLFPWGEFRARAVQAEAAMARLGEGLFDAIFGTIETAALYAHVADHLHETRVVIHAGDAEGIALPWECLRDRTRGEYGEVARRARVFVRSQPDLVFEPPETPEAGATLNILLVICRPGGPEGDVPFQSVARPLLELFRDHRDRVRLDVLRPPTLEQLGRVLADRPGHYHVLHFDGHGAFPEGGDPTRAYGGDIAQGRLLFEAEGGGKNEVSGERLGGLLAGMGVPAVVLNACQSGMTHPEALYPSVGNQLLRAGVVGVVAMAYSVYVQTAVRFMKRLYEALLNGEELARAVTLGREELCLHPQRSSPVGEIPLSDWVVPVLFESAPVRLAVRPAAGLRLGPVQDHQEQSTREVGCPEPPAFGLVGRDGVMLDLERAFEAETVVLLEGMAGVGKTETAVGFARWRAETGALNGPIVFTSFEHHTPLAHVCDRVGTFYQEAIKTQIGQEWHLLDAGQRRDVALRILRQVPCFLIWDNFEPVAGFPTGTQSSWTPGEREELRRFLVDLRGGRTKVLVTSRRDEPWLGPIYRRVPLRGLKLAEAQDLAVRVLRRSLDSARLAKLGPYDDLLKYLNGNPLAIQVILPELDRQTPDALLRSLRSGETKLAADDPAQGRDRSLSASLTYRLDALDDSLRRRLGVLALFQGFVDVDVLSLLCSMENVPESIRGIGRDAWVKDLDVAAEIGLLRGLGGGCYTVHPALPWFFHDLAGEAFPDRLADLEPSYAESYSGLSSYLVTLMGTNTQLAMTLLRYEESNLLHAVQIARRSGLWDAIWRIIGGLDSLYRTQGRWLEWERLVTEITAEVSDAKGEPIAGRDRVWVGLQGFRAAIAYYRHDYDRAHAIWLRLNDHYENNPDERALAVTLHQLGMMAQQRRRLDEAEGWYRQSLVIEERIGNDQGQAITLHGLGRVAEDRNELVEAATLFRRAEAIFQRMDDPKNLGIVQEAIRRVEAPGAEPPAEG